jgi:hypothetical protein
VDEQTVGLTHCFGKGNEDMECVVVVWTRNKEKSGVSRRDPMAKTRR